MQCANFQTATYIPVAQSSLMRLRSIEIDIKAYNADCISFKVDLVTNTLIGDKKVTERRKKLLFVHDFEPL